MTRAKQLAFVPPRLQFPNGSGAPKPEDDRSGAVPRTGDGVCPHFAFGGAVCARRPACEPPVVGEAAR